MTYQILAGDCLEIMRGMADNSIQACITDPPYGLGTQKRFGPGQKATKGPPQYARQTSGFMNLEWDRTGIENNVEMWSEVYRILTPGAYLLAFGGSQTFHRMACAIEDAGFDLKPALSWLYATGFPHGINIALQFEQRLCDRVEIEPGKSEWLYKDDQSVMVRQSPFRHPLANEWDGWNSSLKPAWEPIIVGRKSIEGSNAENAEKWGTGCFNVFDCRIGDDLRLNPLTIKDTTPSMGSYANGHHETRTAIGRYPSNVILDESMARELDRQSTGASRFYFVAKPTRAERDEGLNDLVDSILNRVNPGGLENDPRWAPKAVKNHHGCVKPVTLLRYLSRLVTPPGGTILDCFLGSGTGGVAAVDEGFSFIGIEKEDSYIPIATARIAHAAKLKEQESQTVAPTITIKDTTFTQSVLPGVNDRQVKP